MPNTQTQEVQPLTRDWFIKLEEQSASNFINLPIEFQLRKYDYNFISKSYLKFFQGDNIRADKLTLARKFLKFVRSINKNRAKAELGEEFFLCFEYFMENFSDLLAKQDMIHLDTLSVLSDAIDKSQFIEDIISIEELQRRVKNLEIVSKNEKVITTEFKDFLEGEYKVLNNPKKIKERDRFLLLDKPKILKSETGISGEQYGENS